MLVHRVSNCLIGKSMVFYFKGVITMKDKLTQSEFNRISELVHCALDAPNKKEAERYIQQIPYVCLYLCGPARNILSELTAATKSASGRVSNKERLSYFSKMSLYKLQDFISHDEGDD